MAIVRQPPHVPLADRLQVSLPHFTSPKFLKDAICRYVNFLRERSGGALTVRRAACARAIAVLKQTYPDLFLTPCYDFDLAWHTHMAHPLAYHRDCTAAFGALLKHDDSVNDRSKNSKLLRGEAATKKAWTAHFKEVRRRVLLLPNF